MQINVQIAERLQGLEDKMERLELSLQQIQARESELVDKITGLIALVPTGGFLWRWRLQRSLLKIKDELGDLSRSLHKQEAVDQVWSEEECWSVLTPRFLLEEAIMSLVAIRHDEQTERIFARTMQALRLLKARLLVYYSKGSLELVKKEYGRSKKVPRGYCVTLTPEVQRVLAVEEVYGLPYLQV